MRVVGGHDTAVPILPGSVKDRYGVHGTLPELAELLYYLPYWLEGNCAVKLLAESSCVWANDIYVFFFLPLRKPDKSILCLM